MGTPILRFLPLLTFVFFAIGCAGNGQARNLKIADNIILSSKTGDNNYFKKLDKLARKLRKSGFAPKKLKKYSDKQISRLYEALSDITYLFPENNEYVSMQEKVFIERIKRPGHNDFDIIDMFKTYLQSRRFDKAKRLKNEFQNIKFPSMPETIISNGEDAETMIYKISDKGKKAELKPFPIDSGPKIIMLMIPGCSVAERAMEDIMKNKKLSAVFKKFGFALTNTFNADSVSLWKSHFNFEKVYIARKASDFKEFDFKISPNFYFLKDGKIKFHIEGWGGEKEEMLKGFKSISVSPED